MGLSHTHGAGGGKSNDIFECQSSMASKMATISQGGGGKFIQDNSLMFPDRLATCLCPQNLEP